VKRSILPTIFAALTVVISCSAEHPAESASTKTTPITISSPAFSAGGAIPEKYTCDGDGVAPPLVFGAPPPRTESFALVGDDPDAPRGTWDHWVVWNIDPAVRTFGEGAPDSGVSGMNSSAERGYGAPCPPDRQHRYFFKLYALDRKLDLAPSSGKKELEAAMKGHILGADQLVGVYDRKKR
jgi:Raf kinase inhibitor-like YbhB/YbcL family protein